MNDSWVRMGEPSLPGNELAYVTEALRQRRLSGGPWVARFEAMLAQYVGARHAIATCNGTAALHLALTALGVGPGDEVLVPALTFVATANAVAYCGARPVAVDVDSDTWCVAAEAVGKAITARTAAVIPVHLYGAPCDMEQLARVSGLSARGPWLVEDAAEGIGTLWRGRCAGSFGEAGVFSFYGNKTLTMGEGGAITTNNDDLAARIRHLAANCTTTRYCHDGIGFNYRLTDLQAAVGVAQLEQVTWHETQRLRVAGLYQRALPAGVIMQPDAGSAGQHGRWAVAVLLPEGCPRNRVMAAMAEARIETRPGFTPINQLPSYAAVDPPTPVAWALAPRILVLPTHAGLGWADVRRVCDALGAAL